MKTRRISMIAKLWLALVAVLILLVWAASGGAMSALDEQLIEAARSGDLGLIKSLLDKGANVNAKTRKGWTALISVAGSGRLELVELLLEKGADVNAKTDDGLTALMMAADRGHTEVVRLLLNNEANVNAKGDTALTPPVPPNLWDNQFVLYVSTALIMAAHRGHSDVVRLLLDNGADVSARNQFGTTALAAAVWKGRLEVMKILFEKGADANEDDGYGTPILSNAAAIGNTEGVRLLLEKGAAVNATDKSGSAAVMRASCGMCRQEVVTLLKEHGAEMTLVAAACLGDLEAAQRLLEKVDVNASDRCGWTALATAAREGHFEMTKLLLEKGAAIDVQSYSGATALWIASSKGNRQIVELLKAYGAKE